MGTQITVRVVRSHARSENARRQHWAAALYNARWLGGTFDAETGTWAIPAEKAADLDRFIADGMFEIVI